MHRSTLFIALLIGALNLLCLQSKAQYTLDEIGVNAGGGLGLYSNPGIQGRHVGAGANVNAFYGHYFCGKSYGIHTQAGFNYFNIGTDIIRFSQVQFEGGFFLKWKLKDYHRPKEWAIIIGPKFQVPLLRKIKTDPQFDIPVEGPVILPIGHVSLQFRRPAKDKKSWFIQPGFEYSIFEDFQLVNSVTRRTYFFLHFGYAFFDKRG